jgi:hypothetical protein
LKKKSRGNIGTAIFQNLRPARLQKIFLKWQKLTTTLEGIL